MHSIRTRLGVLVGLAVVGVALAGASTALGVTAPIAQSGPDAEFVVSEENVTFSNGATERTVVEDLEQVESLRFEERDAGHFAVETESERPLTAAERQRAREIATDNETVREHLDGLDEYELTVEPIQQLEVNSVDRINTTVSKVNGSDEFHIAVEDDTFDGGNGTVVVQRDPDYVEDEVVVKVHKPDETDRTALKYSVRVDLANETVTGITDWAEIRRESTTIDTWPAGNATATDQP